MAGLGVKLFLSGDVLTAAEINGYFMDQSINRFATETARNAAFGDGVPIANGGSGKPALAEGRTAWIDNTNSLQVYDGASWLTIIQANPTDIVIEPKTANYTLVIADKDKMIEMNTAVNTPNTVTIPTEATVAFSVGTKISIIQYGQGKTQILGAGGVNIKSTPGAYLRAQFSSATAIKRATDEWYLIGDLSET